MSKDYYGVLGISKNANADEIKKAYRKLAMKYHPDKNQGDKVAEQKFREATDAYDILRDDQKRAAYDRYGSAAFEQGGFGQQNAGGASGFSGFGFGGSFSDIIDEMFGDFTQSQSSGFQQAGSDVRFNLEVSLEEAFKGTTARIKFTTNLGCDSCKSSGSEGNASPTICSACNGRGKSRHQQGFFTIERSCANCSGSGHKIANPCRTCHGSGRTRKEKNLEVKIPAGIEEGTRIRLAKEGEAGLRGGPAGDLYVFLSIRPHRFFKRQNADIYCKVPIAMVTSAMGGEIEVPALDGSHISLKIPAGTQSNHQFRIRNKGMSQLRSSSRGDMLIEVAVETPVNLTKKQKDLLLQFQEEGKKSSNSPQSTGFFAKVKEFWDELGSGN